MKILHIASPIAPISERAPGGAEQCVSLLARAQQKTGHDVQVLAPNGSNIDGVQCISNGVTPGSVPPIVTGQQIAELSEEQLSARTEAENRALDPILQYVRGNQTQYDVIHNHAYDAAILFDLNKINTPIVHTLHCPPLAPWIVKRLRQIKSEEQCRYITVSQHCAADYAREAGWTPWVVYNGINLASEIVTKPEPVFAWVGRLSPEKGFHHAAQAVIERGKEKLVCAGRIYDEEYAKKIAPLLNHPLVDYRGYVTNAEAIQIMGSARAFLFPIEWEEPFGLVLVEALSMGTPVIAFDRGAVREIVDPNLNGFVVKNAAEMENVMDNVDRLSREKCTASVQRFSAEAMAVNYLTAYHLAGA